MSRERVAGNDIEGPCGASLGETAAATTAGADDERPARLRPQLTIAHHPDARFIGARLLLRKDEPEALCRGGAQLGPGALDDSRLSRRHVLLSWDDTGVWAKDLGSRNRTLVNGAPIEQQRLGHGDVVTLGRVLLVYHEGPVAARPEPHPFIVGVGGAIAELLAQIRLVGPQPQSVLVQGETGVGKELVARALHVASGRAGPFVALNCGGLADGLIHSELFGHVRGAFSGAERSRDGLVQAARGGTLLLDEIGDASPSLQASLLRLLEQREFRPVGGDEVVQTDVRFVAASHVPLRRAVEEGRFRADLFGRLDRWVVRVPPLRERPEDIVPLALSFAHRLTGGSTSITGRLAFSLVRHRWPRNVRELEAVIEQAVIAAPDRSVLDLTDALVGRLCPSAPPAPDAVRQSGPATGRRPSARPRPARERPSAEGLRELLAAAQGNIKALAAELGVGRTTLYRWLDEAGLDPRLLRGR